MQSLSDILDFSNRPVNSAQISKNMFDTSCPLFQSFLTPVDQVISQPVEWNNISTSNGILQQVFTNSSGKFNTNELKIHYSLAEKRKPYDSNLPNNIFDNCDIINAFNSNDSISGFMLPKVMNCFFGITFSRIKVKPQSYFIRSIPSQCNLVSFAFEGYDEENKKWDLLDQIYDYDQLSSNGDEYCFPVTAEKSYSSFMIKQISPGKNGFWGFSVTSFEIYGVPALRCIDDCRDSLDFETLKNGVFPFE